MFSTMPPTVTDKGNNLFATITQGSKIVIMLGNQVNFENMFSSIKLVNKRKISFPFLNKKINIINKNFKPKIFVFGFCHILAFFEMYAPSRTLLRDPPLNCVG